MAGSGGMECCEEVPLSLWHLDTGDIPSLHICFQQLEYNKDLYKQSWHGKRGETESS